MTTFFSVDVETSDLTPWTGWLLTVGAVAYQWDAESSVDPREVGRFYVRIDRSEELEANDAWWYGPGSPEAPSATALWWADQSSAAQDEAWRDRGLVRHSPEVAAKMLAEFAVGLAPNPEDRVFVANPVAFDKMWIDSLYAEAGIDSPFHYRSLCLRSMSFGLTPGQPWGGGRDNHAPLIEHHALYDAEAQGRDLVRMLAKRDGPKERR